MGKDVLTLAINPHKSTQVIMKLIDKSRSELVMKDSNV